MWMLYVVGGIIAIILFCSFIGIIFMWSFYDPLKKFRK